MFFFCLFLCIFTPRSFSQQDHLYKEIIFTSRSSLYPNHFHTQLIFTPQIIFAPRSFSQLDHLYTQIIFTSRSSLHPDHFHSQIIFTSVVNLRSKYSTKIVAHCSKLRVITISTQKYKLCSLNF